MARKQSELERKFALYWPSLAPTHPDPKPEFEFALPRKWRFDFAWPDVRVAVEMQGGTWIQGRHSRGKGQTEDANKLNTATLLGWDVMYFTSDMFANDPAGCIEMVKQLIDLRREFFTYLSEFFKRSAQWLPQPNKRSKSSPVPKRKRKPLTNASKKVSKPSAGNLISSRRQAVGSGSKPKPAKPTKRGRTS